jgi:isopentenyl-diphosphate delta-isomerase
MIANKSLKLWSLLARRDLVKMQTTATIVYDASQTIQFNDKCLLVDDNDRPLGPMTKEKCHLIKNIENGMLHRAFSVFLFDTNDRLLLQQRSLKKITFPDHWTNTCCSHPSSVHDETDESEDFIGIKRAAKRRLVFELGIEASQLDMKSLHYITRIRYKADNVPHDGIFAEHEIDYVLFLRGNFKLNLNADEIKEVAYVTQSQLKELLEQEKNKKSTMLITPWFKLIADHFLFHWWAHLSDLNAIKDYKNIHKLS